MKKITMFYLEECPFCQKAKKAMDELMTENKAYQSLDIEKIEESEKLQNYTALGLFLFVAVPLPGTGAWVGSLIANFLNLPPKKAIPPIVAGVLVAGIIVLAVTAAANGGIQYLFNHVN